MKKRTVWLIGAISLACCSAGLAQNLAFDIRAEKKKLSAGDKSDDGTAQTRNEEWGYEIKITNKSFKQVKDLRVDYIVFAKDAKPGSTASPTLVRQKNQHQVEEIGQNKFATFTTEPVGLEKTQLKGGWRWASGANPRSHDRLYGMWVRIYKDDQLVGEYTNPPHIKNKEKWEQ